MVKRPFHVLGIYLLTGGAVSVAFGIALRGALCADAWPGTPGAPAPPPQAAAEPAMIEHSSEMIKERVAVIFLFSETRGDFTCLTVTQRILGATGLRDWVFHCYPRGAIYENRRAALFQMGN
jgi:hypothetical protein